jgi:HK97 family phage prohead protease
MTAPLLYRIHSTRLEVRADGDGRTLAGLVVPYGVEAHIGPYTEQFTLGAFADADPAQVPLTATHPRDGGTLPIGISTELAEQPDGLHGAWRVSKTQLGDEVLELVRDGAVSGLSVGFIPLPGGDRWSADRSRVERRHAILDHVAVVRAPAYPDARIAALRAAQVPATPRLRLARLLRR